MAPSSAGYKQRRQYNAIKFIRHPDLLIKMLSRKIQKNCQISAVRTGVCEYMNATLVMNILIFLFLF